MKKMLFLAVSVVLLLASCMIESCFDEPDPLYSMRIINNSSHYVELEPVPPFNGTISLNPGDTLNTVDSLGTAALRGSYHQIMYPFHGMVVICYDKKIYQSHTLTYRDSADFNTIIMTPTDHNFFNQEEWTDSVAGYTEFQTEWRLLTFTITDDDYRAALKDHE
ncbi:MAG: hypothetical protein IJ760_03460 [Bacteroidales bacterium]|nr:hypothetical protein [Bacteroidales bacterium]